MLFISKSECNIAYKLTLVVEEEAVKIDSLKVVLPIAAVQAEGVLRKIADKISSPTICVSLYLNKVKRK